MRRIQFMLFQMRWITTKKLFITIVTFRLVCWLLVRTYFIADEYWQTFEIAHSLAFGYGYTTWEWQSNTAIRSYLYPFIISIFYRFLALLDLDSVPILIGFTSLFQTLLAITGDLAYVKCLQGHRLTYLILLCRFTCWYTMYSSPRMLVNNLEEILFIHSLASAVTKESSSHIVFHFFASLSFIIRPTSIIPFVIVYPYLLLKTTHRFRFLIRAGLCFIVLNLCNTLLDSYMYDQWTFVPFNFFRINFLHSNSISSHYGINNLLWYFTNGLPMIFFYRLPFVFLGSLQIKRLSLVVLFTILIYTLNEHKEFRFLSQILPILFILEAFGIDWCMKRWRWSKLRWIIIVFFAGHVLLGTYFSVIDRRGQIDVIHWLRTNLIDQNSPSIDFLMPCHSTPYHAFIHRNDVSLHFLTCEPNLNGQKTETYIDEADQFFLTPIQSLQKRLILNNASHLVMFDTLFDQLREELSNSHFIVIKKLFNSHIQHTSRHGKWVYILEKSFE